MTDFDLDRLGDVWRQQPDPAELERLQKSAAAVARRARFAQVVDVATAIAVALVVIVLVASHPKVDTVLIGAAAILVVLGSNIRLRKLRRIELRNLTGTTEDMLDQSIVRAETTLRHHRFGLIGIGPAIVIGVAVAWLAQGRQLFHAVSGASGTRLAFVALAAAAVGIGCLYSLRGLSRARRELERLRAMREAYRRERESTAQ
jgi:hypothetical protein